MEFDETQECRIDPECYPTKAAYLNMLKHRRAYEEARDRAEGKHVLDFACGTGYGVHTIAEKAASVVGVDASPVALEHCAALPPRDNVRFQPIKADYALPFDDASFDMVVSFQVIEHIPDVPRYLKLLKRVTKPGGQVLLSTPNRKGRLLPFQRPWNPAHYREYSAAGYRRELEAVFSDVEILAIHGSDHYNGIILDATRQTIMGAYVRKPMRRLLGKILPAGAIDGMVAAKQKVRPTGSPAFSEEMKGAFSVADVEISSDLSRALDFLAICVKTA